MFYRFKKALTTVLAAFAVISAAVGLNLFRTDALKAGAEGQWTGYTASVEDGVTVYTSPSSSVSSPSKLEYSATTGDCDAISFSMRTNKSWNSQVEAHLSFYMETDGGVIGFKIMNYWKAVRIEFYDDNGETHIIKDAANYADNGGGRWLNTTQWYDFTIVFSETTLEFYVGDTRCNICANFGAYDVSDVKCYFGAWGCSPSIKNIELFKRTDVENDDWFGEYTVSEENGETVYTATGAANAVKDLYYVGNTGDNNVLEFDFRPNAAFGGYDLSHITAYICCYPHEYIGFRFMNYWNASRIIVLKDGAENKIAEAKYVPMNEFIEGWTDQNTWYNVKVYFSDQYMITMVDGYISSVIHHAHGYPLSNKPIIIGNWGHNASVKNISLRKEDVSGTEIGYMDLEFHNESSVSVLTATGGEVGFDDGCAVFDVTDNDATLKVNVCQTTFGSYAADLHIRNSVLIRLKNLTDAKTLTMGIRSSLNSTLLTKTVDLIEGDDFNTYLVNFSSYAPRGYLAELTITPDGVNSGSVVIDAISFEREDNFYDYAGEITSCTADKVKKTVTVTGKVKQKYADRTVTVYTTPVKNFTERLDVEGVNAVALVRPKADGTFKAEFSLYENDGFNRLSMLFIVACDGMKLSKAFRIENYRDFIENPYAFELPALTVRITDAPFNAVGDSFTDDTDAIQAAIDHVSSMGGGTVIVPGDTAIEGGRRYMLTHIKIKDNVELRIEKGAVLWQSPRYEDYKYDVLFGHDYISDSMWPHACNVNYPLILMKDATNVRLTGGGVIRLMDWGMNAEDPVAVVSPNTGNNCPNVIHVAPIYVNNCENIEISDLTILHTNNWHITTTYARNMCVMNMTMKEASCANSDGIALASTHYAFIARNLLYSNDDSITLLDDYGDPRRSSWWNSFDETGYDLSLHDAEICYNNFWGGLGYAFIPWGSGCPDYDRVGVKNLVMHDNFISGFQDIGSWSDNPFYGTSKYTSYNFNEVNDASPVYNIYMYNNRYSGVYCDLSWAQAERAKAYSANFITDAPYECSSEFLNGSFERDMRFDDETEFTSGLSYWTFTSYGGSADTVARGTKTKKASLTGNSHVVTDYAACVTGGGALWQGLYLKKGVYTFTGSYLGNNVSIFVGRSEMRYTPSDDYSFVVIGSKALAASSDYALASITFAVDVDGVYALGFTAEQGEFYFDDCFVAANDDGNEALSSVYAAIEEAETVDASIYTAESLYAFNAAVETLRALTFGAVDSVSEYYSAVEGYERAFAALETISEEPSDSSSQSSEVGPASSSAKENEASKADTEPSGGCGGTVTSSAIITLLIVFSATLLCIRKKRKNADN
ncbi:MAG: hypothetical protein J5762_07560 [Clostridia bacterium]|nr:hypothetical protein [Clostridia bacterium]